MNHGGEHHTGEDKKYDARKQGIQTGEPLSCCRVQRINRPHAPEEHRSVQKRIRPRQSFDEMVNRHSDRESTDAQRYNRSAMAQHSANDMPR